MVRRLLTQHATSECPKRTQPCSYCTKEFVFDTIQVRLFLTRAVAGAQGIGTLTSLPPSAPLEPPVPVPTVSRPLP